MDYMNLYSREYLMPIYYYCLKKTSDVHQAEELAGEISCEVLNGLSKIVPKHFSAWVWQIARNCYCHWARNKRNRIDTVCAADISEMTEIIIDDDHFEAQIEYKEELEILRRELAFIQSDYRNILVAFYINDKKIRDIAVDLSLPEGTVKTRLFYGRNKLKEGMNMAREFGKRSYNPEDVEFSASGNQAKSPWGYVERKINKNILLEAHNNPSTIEELALELGVAVPYMEEEAALLVEGDLLFKLNNNKYVTNFYIANREVQKAIYDVMRQGSVSRCKLLTAVLKDKLKDIRSLGIMNENVSDNELKWLLYTRIIDLMNQEIEGYGIWGVFHHKDGSNWGFIGYEVNDMVPKPAGLSQNGSGENGNMIWIYAYDAYGYEKRLSWMDNVPARLMIDIIQNNRNITDLSKSERTVFDKVQTLLYEINEEGFLVPKFAVFKANDYHKMMSILQSHPSYQELKESLDSLYKTIRSILMEDSIPLLHKYIDYYASMFMCKDRMLMVTDAVEAGELLVPVDPEHSAAGIYMELTK
jgi:RNA polymerase sigma-70 factor (ECF subfamily)